jgi:hypothetical protein
VARRIADSAAVNAGTKMCFIIGINSSLGFGGFNTEN